ncbi:MAG TPA: thymidine phosphorylase, partial [Candidatus Nanoarchaeia archaeon]|nr:thymidine phosphorylase [Candidatus Nanoarchaeia archaeon]
KKLGKHVEVMITDGSQPIGNGIGPSLEARDVMWILKRDSRRPLDLEKKCIAMCANIFKMAGIKDGAKKAIELLDSGKAYRKMEEIIKAQGGKEINPEKIAVGKYAYSIVSKKSGTVKGISNAYITRIARIAGAPQNKGAGIYIYKHVNDRVKKGDKLYTIHAESEQRLKFAKEVAENSLVYVLK